MVQPTNAVAAGMDSEIIAAILSGHRDRYTELVDRYQLAAWKLAYSMVGNMDDAKELSQNGFVKAYQHLRSFRGTSKFSTWLYRIIVNECKDFLKAKSRRPMTVSLTPTDGEEERGEPFELEDPSRDPRDAAADREMAGRLSSAMKALPMQQGMAFRLHHVEGHSLEDVAQIMGCRVGTVKAHVFRACERLRLELEPYLNGRMA